MYCKNCKKLYPDDRRFCGVCGSPLTDELDIYAESFRSGDAQAFESIYKNSYKWVRRYVYDRIAGNDVEDCVQNIYVKLYENISKYDPGTGKFRPWFNTLMRNETIDYIRKANSRQGKDVPMYEGEDDDEMDFEDTSAVPEDVIDQKETERLMREILTSLTEEQRICVVLYYMENMKQDEIARELEISAGTVKSRLHYGKEKIKERVLALERQGTKLYGLAPVPFFVWLLHKSSAADLFTGSSSTEAIWNSINIKTAAAKAPGVLKSAGGGAAAKSQGTAAAQAAAKAGAGAAQKAAAGAIGKVAVGKIVAGVVIAGLAAGGGYAGYRHVQSVKQTTETAAETQTERTNPQTDAEEGASEQTARNVAEQLGYEYIGNRCEAEQQMIDIPQGYISSDTRDFDGDGEDELLLLTVEDREGNDSLCIRIHENSSEGWKEAAVLSLAEMESFDMNNIVCITGDNTIVISDPETNYATEYQYAEGKCTNIEEYSWENDNEEVWVKGSDILAYVGLIHYKSEMSPYEDSIVCKKPYSMLLINCEDLKTYTTEKILFQYPAFYDSYANFDIRNDKNGISVFARAKEEYSYEKDNPEAEENPGASNTLYSVMFHDGGDTTNLINTISGGYYKGYGWCSGDDENVLIWFGDHSFMYYSSYLYSESLGHVAYGSNAALFLGIVKSANAIMPYTIQYTGSEQGTKLPLKGKKDYILD